MIEASVVRMGYRGGMKGQPAWQGTVGCPFYSVMRCGDSFNCLNVISFPDMKSKGRSYEPCEIRLIGCCGAYCKTCRPFILGSCRGCKIGYDDGSRSMARARCKIKVCCYGLRKLETCAECAEHFGHCHTLERFYSRNKGGYERYRKVLELIRTDGYREFIKRAKNWKNNCGDL